MIINNCFVFSIKIYFKKIFVSFLLLTSIKLSFWPFHCLSCFHLRLPLCYVQSFLLPLCPFKLVPTFMQATHVELIITATDLTLNRLYVYKTLRSFCFDFVFVFHLWLRIIYFINHIENNLFDGIKCTHDRFDMLVHNPLQLWIFQIALLSTILQLFRWDLQQLSEMLYRADITKCR